MPFTGLRPDALDFYAELAANNSKEWWLANRSRYDESVRGPFEQLGEALADEFGPVKIFRPFRDVRFSTDKTPYKLHIGMVSRERIAHYVQLSDQGMLVGGGVFDAPTPALARFRQLVNDSRSSGDVEAMIEEVEEAGFSPMSDGALRTAPRGFPVDHPRIGLLRLTRLAISRSEPPADWMWGEGALDVVRERWRTVSSWNAWLAENLGETLIERR